MSAARAASGRKRPKDASGRKELWLLRHAKTLQDPPPGGADRDRRLAPRGERDADALGKRLRDAASGGPGTLGTLTVPGLILSSSAVRAVQTTQAVAAHLDPQPTVEYLDSLYAASSREVLRHVARSGDDLTSVMVVGHNPTAETLAAALLAERDRAGRKRVLQHSFPTCALAIYELPGSWRDIALGTARLLKLLTPPY